MMRRKGDTDNDIVGGPRVDGQTETRVVHSDTSKMLIVRYDCECRIPGKAIQSVVRVGACRDVVLLNGRLKQVCRRIEILTLVA